MRSLNVWEENQSAWIEFGRVSPLSSSFGTLLFGCALLFVCALLFAFDALVYLLAMHGDILWCVDADPHLVTFHTENSDSHIIADHHSLANSSCQYQHCQLLLSDREWLGDGDSDRLPATLGFRVGFHHGSVGPVPSFQCRRTDPPNAATALSKVLKAAASSTCGHS